MWSAIGLALLGLAIWIALDVRRSILHCRRLNTVERLPRGQFSATSEELLLRLAGGGFRGSGVPGYRPPYRLDTVLNPDDGRILALFSFKGSGPIERLALPIDTDADVADLFVRMGGKLTAARADANLSEGYRRMLDAYSKSADSR